MIFKRIILNLIFNLIIILLSVDSIFAYIPSSRMIVDKVVEKSLRMPLYVEQEVQLTSSQGSATLREQWLFENENSIKLIVKGEKDLQDLIQFQVQYSDTQRLSTLSGVPQASRMGHPLFEKIFFIKSSDILMRFLVQLEIVTSEIFKSQIYRKIPGNNGFQYQPELFVRLGRLGGRVTYILGQAPMDEKLTPGFWVEQDLFQFLKLRNSQGEEFRFDKLISFNRGAKWPKEFQLTWGIPTIAAQIQTQTARMADSNLKQLFQKKIEKRKPEFEQQINKNLVEEFYSRFR